jgi:hypothetical protein
LYPSSAKYNFASCWSAWVGYFMEL